MSIIAESTLGFYISHEQFINKVYNELRNVPEENVRINSNLFNIVAPYKSSTNNSTVKRKNKPSQYTDILKEQEEVKLQFTNFFFDPDIKNFINHNTVSQIADNKVALQTADHIQTECGKYSVVDVNGVNNGPPIIKIINDAKFLFPKNAEFYSKDVTNMTRYLEGRKFDLILLDPPWWNKYIRRKRKKSSDGYNMMFNEDLKNLPIGNLLTDNGLIAVWCTNSRQNLNALLNEVFPHWKVQFAAKWYWLKVTQKGEPVCNFAEPPGKQPYEKIIFAYRERNFPLPEDSKLLVSVPSALHSHKPPLIEVLEKYLPKNPRCLEVFARYLLPGWTSYGNEVLKLQHESLFILK